MLEYNDNIDIVLIPISDINKFTVYIRTNLDYTACLAIAHSYGYLTLTGKSEFCTALDDLISMAVERYCADLAVSRAVGINILNELGIKYKKIISVVMDDYDELVVIKYIKG